MRQDGDGHTGGRDPSKAGLFDFDYDKGDLVLWPTTSGIATSGTVAQIDEAHFDAVRSRLAAATQLADF
jgi:hypothetical protein